jgi:hypothetical protein
VIPPQSTASGTYCFPFVFYSPDLSRLALQDGLGWGEGHPNFPDSHGALNCSHDEPALVEGEPRGAQNLFLRNNDDASYQLVNETPAALPPRDAWFQAGSSDFSHVVFNDPNALTPEAPTPPSEAPDAEHGGVAEDLYDWAGGAVRLVTILPGGESVWGLLANSSESGSFPSSATWTHPVSANGERVFFRAGGTIGSVGSIEEPKETYVGGGLFLRENAMKPRIEECAGPTEACTVQIDSAQGGPESGDGHFQWASADGSKAFFTDARRLVSGAKAEAERPDLYEYDLARPAGSRLVDLTAGAVEPANVQGLSGISEDGADVYFVATGDLIGGQVNSQGEEAIAGSPNLYLEHGGVTTFIATLDARGEDAQPTSTEGDTCDWDSFTPTGLVDLNTRKGNCMSARVTPDGAFLAFQSKRSLTGYDNVVQSTGLRDHEIFLYDATTNKLSCASCDPEGRPPTADPEAGRDPRILPPMQVHTTATIGTTYLTQDLTDDGRVFFETDNKLLPGDENGKLNVYEFAEGHLGLISSGKGPEDARFEDASADGSDVFFITTDALVAGDTDSALSLYDARVGGGFAGEGVVREVVPGEVCASGEACKAPPGEPPVESFPASAAFSGAGNLVAPAVKPTGPGPVRPRALTRAQKLAKALALCKKKPKRLRAACQRRARGLYGPTRKARKTTRTGQRGQR